jgi:predicted aldo/keto reductase-like oxidoreductase
LNVVSISLHLTTYFWNQSTCCYQGVTARFISDAPNVTIAVLALKEVMVLREMAKFVQSVAEHMIEKYRMNQKVLNIYTDRTAVKVCIFRDGLVSGRCVWIPCTAHFLNLMFSCFYDHASDMVGPIFDIASLLHKQGPLYTYLPEHRYSFVRLPSYS